MTNSPQTHLVRSKDNLAHIAVVRDMPFTNWANTTLEHSAYFCLILCIDFQIEYEEEKDIKIVNEVQITCNSRCMNFRGKWCTAFTQLIFLQKYYERETFLHFTNKYNTIKDDGNVTDNTKIIHHPKTNSQSQGYIYQNMQSHRYKQLYTITYKQLLKCLTLLKTTAHFSQ